MAPPAAVIWTVAVPTARPAAATVEPVLIVGVIRGIAATAQLILLLPYPTIMMEIQMVKTMARAAMMEIQMVKAMARAA